MKTVFVRLRMDGKGQLFAIDLPENRRKEGYFYVTTRRGKQFNSMIYNEADPFNNDNRYDVLLNGDDARVLVLMKGLQLLFIINMVSFKGMLKLHMLQKAILLYIGLREMSFCQKGFMKVQYDGNR